MQSELKVGLVAGRGVLPVEVLSAIKSSGKEAIVMGVKGECRPEIEEMADIYQEYGLGKLGAVIEAFKREDVSELVFAGKVGKEAIFRDGLDELSQKLLASLPQKNDDAILFAIVREFEKNGMTVLKQTEYLQHLLAEPGSIVGTIAESEMPDIKLGFKTAKAMGDLDIGQSVVVKSGVVLAIEAIEGTDQAIVRGGTLGGPGSVVVKVSKPRQDLRFDVPTIGKSTIESMIKAQSKILAIETGKTFFLERDAVLSLAAEHQIKIISCTF